MFPPLLSLVCMELREGWVQRGNEVDDTSSQAGRKRVLYFSLNCLLVVLVYSVQRNKYLMIHFQRLTSFYGSTIAVQI